MTHGKVQTFLHTDTVNIGVLKSVHLQWLHSRQAIDFFGNFKPFNCGLLCNKRLYVQSITLYGMTNNSTGYEMYNGF